MRNPSRLEALLVLLAEAICLWLVTGAYQWFFAQL